MQKEQLYKFCLAPQTHALILYCVIDEDVYLYCLVGTHFTITCLEGKDGSEANLVQFISWKNPSDVVAM